MEAIQCRVVKTHNLKGFDVSLPLGQWIAVTGVSGSGKSSLVFDTIYAEAQRRFLETLGTYERQFLQGIPQGDFESIDNIPAAIALKQTNRSSDPRSVIATAVDVLHPLMTVFSSLMEPSCAQCGSSVQIDTEEDLIRYLKNENNQEGIALVIPLIFSSKDELPHIFKTVVSEGFVRILINKSPMMIEDLLENKKLIQSINEPIYLVLDRIQGQIDNEELKNRVEQAWSQVRFSSQFKSIEVIALKKSIAPKSFFVFPYCSKCKDTTKIIEQGHLDWTSAMGACPQCQGLGNIPLIDESKVIPDPLKPIGDGAIKVWNTPAFRKWTDAILKEFKHCKINVNQPYSQLDTGVQKWLWEGIDPSNRLRPCGSGAISINEFFRTLESESYKPQNRVLLSKYRSYSQCPQCSGTRLSLPGQKAKCHNKTFSELFLQEIHLTLNWVEKVKSKEKNSVRWNVIDSLAQEAIKKLDLLTKLGLGSAHLGRRCRTLSGGEYQRVLLSRVLGNGLSDALYVLDEPSVGLGPVEVRELIPCLQELRDLGNTVLVVEHDPLLVKAADRVIELGPGGGTLGGDLLPLADLPKSLTPDPKAMRSLVKPPRVSVDPQDCIKFSNGSIELKGFTQHNCNNIFFQCPLGFLTVVTGVSGAGKSTLIEQGLLPALELFEKQSVVQHIKITDSVGTWEKLFVPKNFLETHQIVSVEQKALSRSISSVVATVLGVMDTLRDIFGNLEESKRRRLSPGHFSFNSQGACPECEGRGTISDDLFFLGVVEKVCPECEGTRFQNETRRICLDGRSLDQWLACDLDTFQKEFPRQNKIVDKLNIALTLGLGHLCLGTSTTELSGGEAQRLRLAAALGKSKKKLFCIIDEPTRGLSEKDVSLLLKVFSDLCYKGNTFVIVEHHELFKEHAHQLYTMGPGGGLDGGRVTYREVFHAP